MSSTDCLLQRIIKELKELNKKVNVRSNAIVILEIDTSDTNKRTYNIQKIFNAPKNIVATQLTVLDKGGGFYIDINNTGITTVTTDYEIDNEEIRDIEIYGTGTAGTGKLRVGANL